MFIASYLTFASDLILKIIWLVASLVAKECLRVPNIFQVSSFIWVFGEDT